MESDVILVDESDREIGTMEKLKAHQMGLLHRAFSIFLFDKQRRLLLQRRALDKYHSGGLWTNACCSHPYPGESILEAASRRMREELGAYCPVEELFSFIYKAEFENNMIEYEYDHVLYGYYSGCIHINKLEVEEVKYIDCRMLTDWIRQKPYEFTPWFKLAVPKILNLLNIELKPMDILS